MGTLGRPSAQYAPGGKLTKREFNLIKRYAQRKASIPDVGLCDRQVQRIIAGEAWPYGWLPKQAEDDFKHCLMCGTQFSRRFANGRLRSPKFWQQKETCGYTCAMKLEWQRGTFKNRGKK